MKDLEAEFLGYGHLFAGSAGFQLVQASEEAGVRTQAHYLDAASRWQGEIGDGHARRDQGRSAGRASGKICSAHIRLSADYPRASLIVGSYLAASKPSANVKAHRRRGNDKFTLAWLTHATKPSAGGGCNNNALPIDRP